MSKKILVFILLITLLVSIILIEIKRVKNIKVQNPSIKITYPTGGETLYGGDIVNIKWTSNNLTEGKIMIMFYDGNSWYDSITNLDLNVNSIAWDIPNICSTNCKIKVSNYNPSIGETIVSNESNYLIINITYNKWNPVNNNLYMGYVISIAIDPDNTQIIYAGTYKGGLFKSTNGGSSWYEINNGLTNLHITSIAIDPDNTQIIYAGTDGGGVFKSTDGGANWSEINNGLKKNWVHFLTIDPKNSEIIYAGIHGGVFKSTDGGANWNAINNGLTNTYVKSLAIDPKNSEIIYAVTNDGRLFKSTDDGSNWSEINNGLTDIWIYSLAVDPKNREIIYAGTYGRVFKSTDGGANWSEINNGLANSDVLTLTIDPKDSEIIYAGTIGSGVFKSTDGGANWNAINNGLTNLHITSIAIDPKNTQIILAGTGGAGVFKIIQKVITYPGSPTLSIKLIDNLPYLSWNPSKEGTYPIKGYEIYRGELEGNEVLIDSVDSSITTYKDTNVTPGKTYYYYIKAFDTDKNYSEPSNRVSILVPLKDTTPPNLIVTYPTDGMLINKNSINITGSVSDSESGIDKLTINSSNVQITSTGEFIFNVNLNQGINTFYIVTIDKAGNKIEKTLTVYLDITPPEILVSLPNEVYDLKLSINGKLKDNLSGIENLKINGVNVAITSDNSFTYNLFLNEGYNKIIFEAVDKAENKITREFTVKYIKRIMLKLQIGNLFMYVNDVPQEIDVPPQIVEGRTLLPIRWVAEPLGASVGWDENEKKVTVTLKNTTIELWIGKNIAKVNGNYKFIDPDNSKVVPNDN